ncbi:MAG: hypothetical protein A2589_00900 [Candidatus Vogelbacteria bacterium RIFOXYD1_FULL_46_19]|uniref:histidine kinase n=1 Tax=Candidatus Vogelbacteria bacterium RIFOXYD1_FULL_46_19 TaxID=1802439 RepID=A0A1G2QG99_9BACT|nr:MAG: hypothetical protein A2589_00900 [Candidatus Vogelbacteria bacterium RIFOXYD1_FULL_46_19]
MLTRADSLRLELAGRLIFIRLALILAAIFIVGFLAYQADKIVLGKLSGDGLILAILFLVGLLNILFFVAWQGVRQSQNRFWLNGLVFWQVMIDFLAILIVIISWPDGDGALFLLFLWPLLEGVLLFSSVGSLLLSAVAGGSLITVLYLDEQNIVLLGQSINFDWIDGFMTQTSLDELLGWSVVYLVFTLVLSYCFSILTSFSGRESLQDKLNQKEAELEHDQMQWVRQYSQKMDENNRLLKTKELELSLAKQQLEMLENAKSEFVSVTTHQLRTPLSAIKWTFNMILSEQLGPLNQDQKTFLDKGYQSALRMINIVNSLVHIDHATAKKEDYNLAPTDLTKLIENIKFEFVNQAESKKIGLEFKMTSESLPLVTVDENKIRMVVENLIDNAIKYTHEGGMITVLLSDLRLNTAHPAVEISVRDTGVGIPLAEQKKIFHKFFRASNARREEPDGSGIGLYIAKDIVERHQGAMWFETEEGKGTTFFFTLPINQKLKNEI